MKPHLFGWHRRRGRPMSIYGALATLALAAMPTFSVNAALSNNDLQAIGRAVTFQEAAPHGSGTLGILVDPDNHASLTDAAELEEFLKAGLKVDGLTLKVQLIPVSALANGLKVDALLIPDVNTGLYPSLAERLAGLPVLSIGTDPACARSGACIVSVQTQPRTEILVNSNRAAMAGVRFATAFRMVIKEF